MLIKLGFILLTSTCFLFIPYFFGGQIELFIKYDIIYQLIVNKISSTNKIYTALILNLL